MPGQFQPPPSPQPAGGPPPGQPYGAVPFQQFGTQPTTSSRSRFSVWNVLIGLSGAAVAVSIFLDWLSSELFDGSINANDIPLQILWDPDTDASTGFPLRWPLVVAALLMITAAFNLRAKVVALIGSILALAVGLLFLRSIDSLLSDVPFAPSFSDFIGVGCWVCIAAGVVGIIGSIGLMARSN